MWIVVYAVAAATTITLFVRAERAAARRARVDRQLARLGPRRRDVIDECLICELGAVEEGWERLYRDVMRPGDDL